MAVAELAREGSAAFLDALDEGSVGDALVRLEVHDASRFEWSISIPLPEKRPLAYAIDVELEIPSNAFAPHAPWDQLQSFTRLDGPQATTGGADPITIDGLRRHALAVASKLARASDGFSRHCLLVGSLFAPVPRPDLADGLLLWLDAACATAAEARAGIPPDARRSGEESIRRERDLVDEYVSVRLLEALAAAERSLGLLRDSKSPHVAAMREAIAMAEERVAASLGAELERRAARGWICGDPTSPDALERYLDRASRLKKHFQEVLFLEPETFHVAERLHHWAAAIAALLASTWAVAWQLFLAHRTATTESRVGSGLILVMLTGGLVYAAKDRIKEVGRSWISGNVHRFYAQRVARYRAPARRLPSRDVIVAARESCGQSRTSRPDPLNAESGASVPATMVRYSHRGTAFPCEELSRQGVRRIKHVFRYDLSPLFARLDDSVKSVPVLDPETRRVRFAAAPRCYRVPVQVRVRCGGDSQEERVTLVLTKRGLERLERDERDDREAARSLRRRALLAAIRGVDGSCARSRPACKARGMDRARVWAPFDDAWVVHEDEDLLVVDKPDGVPTQSADPERPDDLLARLRAVRGEGAYFGVHQRLDRDTSGALVLARRKEANASLAAQFEGRAIEKRYVAAVDRLAARARPGGPPRLPASGRRGEDAGRPRADEERAGGGDARAGPLAPRRPDPPRARPRDGADASGARPARPRRRADRGRHALRGRARGPPPLARAESRLHAPRNREEDSL